MGPQEHQRCPPIVIPTRRAGKGTGSLSQSIRQTIHKYFIRPQGDMSPHYVDAFRWLIFCCGQPGSPTIGQSECPNKPCSATDIGLTSKSPNEFPCPKCQQAYLHHPTLSGSMSETRGAGGWRHYLVPLGSLEQLVLVQLIKTIYEMKKDLLGRCSSSKTGRWLFFDRLHH